MADPDARPGLITGGQLSLPPAPGLATGWRALKALIGGRGPLAALSAVHRDLGPVFQLPVPGFNPIVMAGPEAARFVMLDARADLSWRLESDPVVRLLRHGLLVEDGAAHAALRQVIDPALHRRQLGRYLKAMLAGIERLSDGWGQAATVDALAAMREASLLILTEALFGVDLAPALGQLWRPILRTLQFIGPGLWLVWPGIPRPGYGTARRILDAYLYALVAARRAAPGDDLVSDLVGAGLDDDAVRDQLLTLLIAGHDTSTALLAWSLHALTQHPAVLARAQAEVLDRLGPGPITLGALAQLEYLDWVVKETLRRHPPIHIGNRRIMRDLAFGGYRLPAGRRLLFSIYLTHHDPASWLDPERFDPERFAPGASHARSAYSYLPFGAGPRFCLGAAFSQLEARAVLAYLLRHFRLAAAPGRVHEKMGATLEPEPAVRITFARR
jgi:cytochrome P450